MALEDVVQAIQLEGGDEIVATLNRIASIGESTFNSITEALSKGGGGFTAFTEGVVGIGTALAVATAATVAFVESQDKAITSLSALANSFGTSISEIQAIKESFAEAGVSGTMLDRSLSILQRNIGNQWSSIAREVRDSATSQTKDQLSIQEATLGTQKAIESLAEAEQHAATLATHQAQERVQAAHAVAAAQLELSTIAVHQAGDMISANNSMEAASQRLREINKPGSVSKDEKDQLKKAEAQAAFDDAAGKRNDLFAKQALARTEAENRAAEARLKQSELAQKQLDEQIKAENSAKEAVLAVQKARLAETEAAQKSHDLDLKNLPKIAEQLNAIAAGHSKVKGEIDLTEVSATHLERALLLAAGGIDGLNKPTGIEALNKMSEVFKGLGGGAEAMGVKMEIVQRLMSAGFRGGGAGMSEMIIAIEKGSGAVDRLRAKIEASDYALTKLDEKAAQDTVGAFATLEGTFARVGEKLAALASPTVTAWLTSINNSIESTDGVLHIFISGIEGIGNIFMAAGRAVLFVTDNIDKLLHLDPGTSLKIAFLALAVAAAAVAPILLGIPIAIGLIITIIGVLVQNWDKIKTAVLSAAQSVSDFERSVEDKLGAAVAYITGPFVGAWNKVSGAIADAVAWLNKYVAIKPAPPPAAPAGGDAGAGAGTGGQWRGGPAGAFAEGGLVSQLVSSIRRFAEGGGAVRGPGSGTSDSILARLSNGEFVMRAAAVRAYGSDIMHAINNMEFPGFAMGGPVAIPVRAGGGGPAKASSTLNLTIDGNRFDGLQAPQDVADKLTSYAISRQTSSAGRRPSWER